MKKRWLISLAFAGLLMVAMQPAQADFYRYVDEHGNVLYTDDLSKVPADQRDKAQAYEESESPAATTGEASDQDKDQKDSSAGDASVLAQERERIEAREKALNDEYKRLMKERSELDKEKQNALTPAQIKAYNQKIVDFNTRIQAYEEKRSLYTDQLESFNERLKANQKESQNE